MEVNQKYEQTILVSVKHAFYSSPLTIPVSSEKQKVINKNYTQIYISCNYSKVVNLRNYALRH
jgi:hypothetical protein